MSETPETDAAIVVLINEDSCCGIEVKNEDTGEYVDEELVPVSVCQNLEIERNELRHKLEICMAANSDVERIAMERTDVERERNALADALRVRLLGICPDCGYLLDIEKHIETCVHYETEKKLLT